MRVLGWKPKVTFKGLIEMMVRADEEDVRGSSLAGAGAERLSRPGRAG